MSGQTTWDLSFLVDGDARILEGRGNCGELLGEPLQNLIGRSLTGLVVAQERKYLRRFLTQLDRPNAKRAVLVNLQSPVHGARPYAMQAQAGRSAGDHWLLFATSDLTGDTFDDLALPPAMLDDGQFLRLVEIAAMQANEPLALTTIEVGGLTKPDGLAGREPEVKAAFEHDIGVALSTQAYEGILANPSPGFFNLLHGPTQSGAGIAADLAQVAKAHGISDSEAGIAHVSAAVDRNATADSIRASLAGMQEKLPSNSWEAPAAPAGKGPFSEGQLAATLGIGAFVIGIIVVALWMLI